MRSSPWISILLVVSAGLAAQTAAAGPQEDVAAAGQKWGTVFADNNPDTIMPLYAKDGVLWGTLSPTVRSDPGRAEGLFRRRLPGVAEGHRQIRRSVDPGLRRHRGQHRLLHILLHQGRRDQVDPGPLQLHLCEGRQRLEDRGPSLVRDARACSRSGTCTSTCGHSRTSACSGTCACTRAVNGRA